MFNPKILLNLLALCLLLSFSAHAQFAKLSFWRSRTPYLKFSTTTQSVAISSCSNIVTVQTANASGVATNVAAPVTINLSATGLTFYSDANCATPITTLTIATGTSSGSFYFLPTVVGSPVITASATAYKDALQSETTSTNPYIWTGGGGNSSWSTGANWSGGSAPGAGSQAIFDSTCVSNCSPTIAGTISVGGIRMTSGYTGTITPGAAITVTVNGYGWYQAAGTYATSSSTLTLFGPYTIEGGTFSATTAAIRFNTDFTVRNTPTFSAGTSTVLFSDRGAVTGNASFNSVTFSPGNGGAYTLTGTLTVNGALIFNNSTCNVRFYNGTIEAKGNVTVNGCGAPGNTLLRLTGSGTQNLDGSAANANINLPAVEIASTGTINFLGNLFVSDHFTFTSATVFNAGTSFLKFIPTYNPVNISLGNKTYYDLGWSGFGTANFTNDGYVSHLFSLAAQQSNTGSAFGPGKIYLTGDLALTMAGGGGNSDLLVVLNGIGNQSITQTSGALSPGIEINSTGGVVTFPATFEINNNFTYTQGSIAGLATAKFMGLGGTGHSINSGSLSLTDVVFNGYNGSTYTIVGALNIGGNLEYASFANSTCNGQINLSGNLTYTSFVMIANPIKFTGGANQTVTFNGGSTNIKLIEIDKTAGSVKLLTNVSWNYDSNNKLKLTSGSFDMNGKNLTTRVIDSLNGNTLTKNGGVLTVNGSVIGTGSLYGGTIAP
jgi:hypothetical protein